LAIINADKFKLRAHAGGVGLVPLNVNDNSFLITKSDYKSVNIGAVVGAGLDLGKLTLDLNYDFGLTDNFNEDAVIGLDGKGSIVSLSVGYVF
ncbi:MAG: outer membrane beta-barrel protein, partial [Bacteroidota bacterium]